jgi:hypothetical protein
MSASIRVIIDAVVRDVLSVSGAARAFVIGVRDGERQIKEKWFFVIHVQPVQGIFNDKIVRVVDALFRPACAAREFLSGDVSQLHTAFVINEKRRVEIMRVTLMEVSIKGVEPLFGGQAVGAFVAESPFAKTASRVVGLLEQFRHGEVARSQVVSAVAADVGVAGVEAGHQYAARWGADG